MLPNEITTSIQCSIKVGAAQVSARKDLIVLKERAYVVLEEPEDGKELRLIPLDADRIQKNPLTEAAPYCYQGLLDVQAAE